MFGFNWIDGLILLLTGAAVYAGLRIGLLTLLLTIGGFFAALILGVWAFPHLLPFHDRTLLTIVNANLVLIVALYTGLRGFDLSRRLRLSLGEHGRKLERLAGMSLSLAAMLTVVWLLAAMIGRLPFAGFSNSANDAAIVQILDKHLPPVPAVFARFDRLIDPNSSPHLLLQHQPTVSSQAVTPPMDISVAAAQAGAGTVRITSFGCGGIVSGSGFIVAPELVVTNAHVIAGVRRPIIKQDGRSYEGVPVLFDPSLDLAVLRVDGLSGKPLLLATTKLADDTPVAIIGYPQGNYEVRPGIVRDTIRVFGRNIYDVGVVGRDLYEIQANVSAGSSGGPIVLSNGQVAGLIFAKSELTDDYAYALESPVLADGLKQARHTTQRVSTGVCLAG